MNKILWFLDFNDYDDTYEDFRPGWLWIGRKMDISDREWKSWIPFMYQLIPWIILHLLVGQLIKRMFLQCSMVCVCFILGNLTILYINEMYI